MGEQRLVPVIGTAHTDTGEEQSPRSQPSVLELVATDHRTERHTFARPMGATPLDEDCAQEGGLDENSEGAREAAVLGNFDTVARQQREIRELKATVKELDERLADAKAISRELVASDKLWRTAHEALKADNDVLVSAHAQLLADKFMIEMRLARLTDDGVPAPASLDAALEQLFDAEAVFAGAEHRARSARGLKFDAQSVRDHAEAAAIVRLVGEGGKRGEIPRPGAMSPTEAKDRLEEDSEYAQLAAAFRNAARTSDECETELRIATSRVETLRECVHAMSNRSPLTARAVAISRNQQ